MGVRIDLHSHSTRSDGTETPAQVVRAAAAAGLDVVALTDHDTVAGWDEAARAAAEVGIELVPGIEISTLLDDRSVHLLAYWPDAADEALRQLLETNRRSRERRLPAVVERLVAQGIDLTMEDVARAAPQATALGRPHVADALAEAGLVADRSEGMAQYLQRGRPGWVPRTGVDLLEAVRVVGTAGGVSVLAHPWGRSARGVLDHDALARLASEGLVGLEVDHEDHSPQDRCELREVAAELGLVVTGSSDHHGSGKVGHELGCHTTAPEEYQRLRDARQRLG